MNANPSIVEMEEELASIFAQDQETMRNRRAIELHTVLDKWLGNNPDAAPADKTRVNAMIGRVLEDVFHLRPERHSLGIDEVEVVVRVTCSATVEEEWTLRVPTSVAALIRENNDEALDVLSEYMVKVENVDVRDEADRDIKSVEFRS